MPFFVGQWVLIVVGWIVHTFADRHPNRRTRARVIELALLWLLVVGGAWAVLGGFAHIGPMATQTAEQIGYTPSMFQWEVGWGDIALGVLGIGCAWRRLRGTWLTAAVVALVIAFGGDAIGHIMTLVAHDNHATSNVWSLPSDILQPLLAVGLLIAYRRTPVGRAAVTAPAAAGAAANEAETRVSAAARDAQGPADRRPGDPNPTRMSRRDRANEAASDAARDAAENSSTVD